MSNWYLNLLINPSFEIGDPPTDWTLTGTGATFVRSTEQIQDSQYSGKLTRVNNDCSINQSLPASAYAGTTLVFGAWVFASVANSVRIYIYDNVSGSTFSVYHSGSSKKEWLSISKLIDSNATQITCYLEVKNTNTSAYFDDSIVFPGGLIPTSATDQLVVSDGHISNIVVLNGGSGYSENTQVTISDPVLDSYNINVLTGGTALASDDFNGSYPASNALDGDTRTWWHTQSMAFPHWWMYDLGAGVTKKVTKLRIYPRPGQAGYGQFAKDFRVGGSDTGSNWTILFNGTCVDNGTVGGWQEFNFTNTTSYRYYVIWFTSVYPATGGQLYTGIGEIAMMETAVHQPLHSTATAIPTIVNGVITKIALVNKGLGYTVDVNSNVANPYPTITITDSGGGTGASAICYVPEGLCQSPWTHSLYSSFAIMQNNTAKSWGYASAYHLGQGDANVNSPLPNFVSFANGSDSPVVPIRIVECYNNTFILDSLGRVWGVGSNDEYELGLNNTTYRSVFTMIPITRFGSSPVVKLKAAWNGGSGSIWALTANGKCYRWGANGGGQLGSGNTTTIRFPTELTSPSGVVDFSFMGADSTYSATMLLDNNGYVWACGYNGYGNLSDGTTTTRNVFQRYNTSAGVGLTGACRIWGGNAGGSYIVGWVMGTDGRIYAAGYNANGQLGNSLTTSTNAGYASLVLRNDLSMFLADKLWFQAASSGGSTCTCYAREKGTGNIYGWGYNSYGELGLGITTPVLTATKLTGVCPGGQGDKTFIIDIAPGHGANVAYTAALWNNGKIYTTGYNGYGQLGDGTTTQRTSWVYANCPQRDIVKIRFSTSDNYSGLQVLCSNGILYTCGANGNNDLGNGATGNKYTLGKVLF